MNFSNGWSSGAIQPLTVSVNHAQIFVLLLTFSPLVLFFFFTFCSSRSRPSTLCSPALWWTCSLSSIRALKSYANLSVQILRLLETTWKDSPRWLTFSSSHRMSQVKFLLEHVSYWAFFSLQTIGNVLLAYADIIAKEFPNHVKKEKVVCVWDVWHNYVPRWKCESVEYTAVMDFIV